MIGSTITALSQTTLTASLTTPMLCASTGTGTVSRFIPVSRPSLTDLRLGRTPALAQITAPASFDLVLADKTHIPDPFGGEMITNRDFFNGSSTQGSVVQEIARSKRLAPERIGRRLDANKRWPTAEIYELGPDHVLLAHVQTIKAVRKLHIEAVLDHLDIPHLRLRQDATALQLARESGVIIRERIPANAQSLDQIANQYMADNWKHVEAAVRQEYGDTALEGLHRIRKQIRTANNDHTLNWSARSLGYLAPRNAMLPSDNVIDSFGNGGVYGEPYWSTNLYYHPDRGWFLINW